jgi:hypothetical protein
MQKDDLRGRTKDFALRVIRMFAALPKTTEAQVLGKQVLRSGTSVGANYREASRLVRRQNSSRNAVIACAKSMRQRTGWSCSWSPTSSPPTSSRRYGRSARS